MRNIVITGFMGTGKTSVGKEVARQLGRPFVDIDAQIEDRFGKSIPDIFAEQGEGVFRHIESQICHALSKEENLVVATGGGTLVDPENRASMLKSGIGICLDADPEEILSRVGATDDRPLLSGHNTRDRITQLLELRSDAYALVPWHINTTGQSIDSLAESVMALAANISLPVLYPGGQYTITLGTGIIQYLGGILRSVGMHVENPVAIVTNPVVLPLYGEQVASALQVAGFQPFICTIPDGEQHKNLDTVRGLYEQLLAGGLDRSGIVIALGGGVAGDTAGYAAATFMRGVPMVQIPTTILAMTDSSVGGKTGVDLPQGKNLLGAFKQPDAVFIDLDVLKTLSPDDVRSGMAEVIKHGIIDAPELFKELSDGPSRDGIVLTAANLARSIEVKIKVVEQDPYEKGRRAVLNLGHTTGHALEQLSQFSMRHGEGVSIGIVAAAAIAESLQIAQSGLVASITAGLEAWELPTRCPDFAVDDIIEAMTRDKKKKGKKLRWVLPLDIGSVDIFDEVPADIVKKVLVSMGARKA
jgi:shikimate kinase/3-dehydroquinate synthase